MLFNNFFTISDFAKLMGISRQTLIYYDRIGLFKPVKTLENGYRLYSRSQINIISLISMLGEMGVPLKEIKTIIDRISPDTAVEVLEKQRHKAREQLRRLKRLEEMIGLRLEQITLGKEILERSVPPISFAEIEEDVPLYLGKTLNCSWDGVSDDDIIDFYAECEKLELPQIFSGGQMKSGGNILAGRTEIISNMCFPLKDPAAANAAVPRGTYAVGYVRGNCENTGGIYRELLSFIKGNGRRVIGNAYEEYLLDELAGSDPDQFVMRITLQVG